MLKANKKRPRTLHLNMLKRILLLFFLVAPVTLFAQTVLTGNIFENENRSAVIQGASIKNLSSNSISLSDKDGHFVIAAKVGDLISFAMGGYQTDTVYLINLFPKNIYLRVQVNTLNTVNVSAVKISPYLDARDPNAKAAKRVEFDKNKGGLRLSLGYGKFKRDRAKIMALEENEEYREEIEKNFNEAYIREMVKFEGPNIRDFMDMFRPTVDQVKAQHPFNYAFYIAKSYSAWLKLPPDQRKLPPLIKPKTNQ